MSHGRHTSLSLRTQIAGLTASLQGCDPAEYFATSRLVQQLGALRGQMERDHLREFLPACTLAARMADVLNRDGQVGPQQALELIQGMVAEMSQSLGLDGTSEAPASERNDASASPQPALGKTAASMGLKMISQRKLGEILVQMSLLTPSQIEQALSHQRMTGCRFGEALVQMRLVPKETIESALRVQNSRKSSIDPWTKR